MSSKPSSPRSAALSLNRQQVLDEDEYTAALSGIIARDFFPSLVHLDATNSYLDALQSEDTQLINESVRRLKDLATPQPSITRAHYPAQTPGRTPYGPCPDDTPLRTPRTETGSNKRPRYDTTLSLDSFQARYTSEDNASFTEIIQEENRKRKERSGWAWEAQQRAQNVKAIETDKRRRLFIEDTTSQPPGVRERLMLETPQVKMITSGPEAPETSNEERDKVEVPKDNSRVENERQITSIVRTPASVLATVGDVVSPTEVDVMAPKKDTRSAAVDGWSFKARNSLMFTPDADVSPYDGPTSLPAPEPKGPPRQIRHVNTRLLEESNETGEGSSSVPPSPTRSRINAAIAGTPYVARGERPDFPLLPSLPSPTPSQLGSAAVNKLMTWGTIMSTPRVLSSEDDIEPPAPATPFHLPGPSPREKLAHKLSSTASRSLRAKASLLSGTPVPSKVSFPRSRRQPTEMAPPGTPRPHPGLLTPAARRLLDRTAGPGSAAARRAEATQNRSSWEGGSKLREMGNVRWTPTASDSSR